MLDGWSSEGVSSGARETKAGSVNLAEIIMKRRDETRRDGHEQTDAAAARRRQSNTTEGPRRHDTHEGGQVTGPGGGAGYGLTSRRYGGRSATGRSAKEAGQLGQSAQPHTTPSGRQTPPTWWGARTNNDRPQAQHADQPASPTPTTQPRCPHKERTTAREGGRNITDPHPHPLPPNKITKQRFLPTRALAGWLAG